MTAEIGIDGPEAADVVRDLRDWLRREGLAEVQVELGPGRSVPDAQGVELATSLLLFLKPRAVTEAVRSINTWIKTRRPKVKMTFKSGRKQLTLEAENVAIDEAMVDNLRALLQEIDEHADHG